MKIYVDGGSTKQAGKTYILSWGFVVEHQDTTVEINGERRNVSIDYRCFHEDQAFIEAMLYAKSRGIAPVDVSFYCDDETISYAAFSLHEGNYRLTKAENIRTRFRQLTLKFYTKEIYEDCMLYLQNSRFVKVKGHESTVYNLRADYLAKQARGGKIILNFEQWLADGFLDYTSAGPFTWLASFARPKI